MLNRPMPVGPACRSLRGCDALAISAETIVGHDFQGALAHHVLHFRDHLLHVERLSEEAAVGGLVIVGQFQLTGHQDDLDQRPSLVDGVGELEAVHASGHLDVGEQQFDVGAGFEDRQRIVGIDGFNGVKPASSTISTARMRSSISSSTTRTARRAAG